jgi:plastocyanin
MMKKLFVILVSVGALAVASPAVAATHGVTITKIAFVPNSLTITTGDSVTWTNSDTSNHQVVSQQAGFASPMLKPGDTFTFTYSKSGKFSYTDSQDKSLKGTVTVQDVPGNVSLQTSATLVTFGGSITLSGVVSNKGAGENVEILRQECNKSTQAMERVTTVQTTTGGAFSFTLQPTMKTTYQVKWKSSTSPSLSVAVRPRIRLHRHRRRR